MNKINRTLVKSQAKQLIKDKVFSLFLICIVVMILTGGVSAGINLNYNIDNYLDELQTNEYYSDDNYDGYSYGYGDFDDYFEDNFGFDYDDYYSQEGVNPFDSFDGSQTNNNFSNILVSPLRLSGISSGISIICFILSPLLVSLAGFFVLFIRRSSQDEFKLGESFANLFKVSFNATYLKKLVVFLLKNLFAFLWSILFIIPGIVYSYSTYFAFELMCDYPNLKPSEALKLSRKIIKGNRTELFTLDLSFIPWYLLMGITCGIAGIYVIPYVKTTKALFYENFRLRAVAEGRVNDDDFLSEEELKAKYNATDQSYNTNYYNPDINAGQGNYYNPNNNAQQGSYYNPDFNENQSGAAYNNSQAYYQPQENQNTASPAEENNNTSYYYSPPQAEQQENNADNGTDEMSQN
ncbi:MAG: DUF975 family protein [Eubacterium sp.]